MGRTLYFAKININDERIFDIYKGNINKNQILDKMFIKIKDGIQYENKQTKKLDDGTIKEYDSKYTLSYINKLSEDVTDVMVGAIIKESKIFLKEINKKNGEVEWRAVPYEEIVRFCLYPRKECVAFYRANRFGYVEFYKVFEELLNKCFKDEKEKSNFKVTLLHKGININSLKNELNKIKNIESLKFEIIPPNVDDELLDEIEKDAEKELDEMSKGNITNKSIVFQSKSKEGLNIKARLIEKEIERAGKIHSKLSDEEAFHKGYVSVEARASNGRTYSTKDAEPIKYTIPDNIDGDNEFAKECRERIIIII